MIGPIVLPYLPGAPTPIDAKPEEK
jgi:hypothetical protein